MFCSFRCIVSLTFKVLGCLLLPLLLCYKYLWANKTFLINPLSHTAHIQISNSLPKPTIQQAVPASPTAEIDAFLIRYGLNTETIAQLRTKYATKYRQDVADRVSTWKHVRPLKDNLKEEILFLCNYLEIATPPRLYSFKENTYAIATDEGIYLNPSKIRTLPATAQLFILVHELGHYFYKDDSLGFIADKTIKTDYSFESINHPINILHRLQEVRADHFALQKSPFFAFGATQFNKCMFKSFHGKDTPGITHPKLSKRLKMAQNSLAKWQNTQLQTV
jgi:hypothetical protein